MKQQLHRCGGTKGLNEVPEGENEERKDRAGKVLGNASISYLLVRVELG